MCSALIQSNTKYMKNVDIRLWKMRYKVLMAQFLRMVKQALVKLLQWWVIIKIRNGKELFLVVLIM